MKLSFSIIILLFCLQLNGQKVIEVGRAQIDYISIGEIQNTNSWTEIMLKISPNKDMEGTLYAPSGASPFVLTDQKGNRYALINQMGWKGSEAGGFGKRKMYSGQSFEVKLFFNKLTEINDIYSLTEANCEHSGCWNFYEIKLKDAVSPKATVSLDSTWVDYDVNDKQGRFGMRIHTKFTVHNLKNKECFLSARFQNEKEEFLTTTNTSFANKSGQISLYKALTPIYDSALFHDESVFLPYSELKLPKGKYNLKYDIDLLEKSGTLIQHLKIGNFTFSQN